MATDKVHLRHCILYEFQQGRNATEACRNLLKVFGEGTVSDRTCRRWYEKFETGDFDLSDKTRSGRPSLIDDDVIKEMLEKDPFLTTFEIAERLNSAQQTISDHIQKIEWVWKCSRWMPHELNQKEVQVTKKVAEDRDIEKDSQISIVNVKLEEHQSDDDNDTVTTLDLLGTELLDVNIKSPEDSYYCDLCGKTFVSSEQFRQHRKSHSKNKLHECDVCSRTYVRSSSLLIHKRVHSGERPFKCNFCIKTFSNRCAAVRHERTHGENGVVIKKFTCEECWVHLMNAEGLKKHTRIHTGVRPYMCDECSKTFATSSTLVTHKRIHSGERPYSCDYCDKKFVTKSHLITHSRTHSGEKPFQCKDCNKKFEHGSSYHKHEKLHSG